MVIFGRNALASYCACPFAIYRLKRLLFMVVASQMKIKVQSRFKIEGDYS